ncbi:hypothetical protein HPP92_019927 [Vanilla planifolia]|uniref:tRNA pseudouridine synthase n=1 Tax=Vanilla planifolia TaxID=51239 RepID=A0A835Q376_VANPL|nr:hypothetical protein HPP92_019927 [Vanilla planifolia]
MQRCRKLMVRMRGIEQILSSRAMSRITSALEKKSFAHYDHKDSCKLSRWTARESFQYMYARPWQKVSDFYLDLVRGDNGYSSLRSLFSSEKNNSQERIEICHGDEQTNVSNELFEEKKRSERTTYKIVLSYHGASFDGWQKQPGLKTVQGLVEESLGIFVDEKKAKKLQENSLPLEGCAVVAGRTDKGVTAIQQICSFYTWRKGVKCHDIKDAINAAAPGKLRVLSVSKGTANRLFHISCTCC